jgi:hypothetical protein
MKKQTKRARYETCYLCKGTEFSGKMYLVYDYCEYLCHVCVDDLLEAAIASQRRREVQKGARV